MKFQKNLKAYKKNVLLRVDLNIPIVNNQITDISKIILLKETIEHLIKQENKVFLLSHLGRPGGHINSKYTLEIAIDKIREVLQLKKIHFIKDYISSKFQKNFLPVKYGEVCLLENIRFYSAEEDNNLKFAKKLSENFDIYINDAFSASHRSHASIQGITNFLPSYAGLLFEKEIVALTSILKDSNRPTMAIIGGSKVSTKISVLKNLVNKLDYLIVGGGMANTFLAAKGINLGSSFIEKNFFKEIFEIEKNSIKSGCTIVLPTDAITANDLQKPNKIYNCSINNINSNQKVFDIGINSCKKITDIFSRVKTVLCNGPLGAFEYKPFDSSTIIVYKSLASSVKKYNLNVIIGGGDTVASIKHLNIIDNFKYVSTSGGAFLEWLEGKELPGVRALERN